MARHSASYWIKHLGLMPHPEGGHYREVYRATDTLPAGTLGGYETERSLSTSIYFLLTGNEVSHFHRLRSEEIWHFYDGSGATIHTIDATGTANSMKIGLDVEGGARPQVLIPRDTWFGAEVEGTNSFILIGCTVAPGFDFADFELGSRTRLLEQFPQHESIINRLTFETA